MHAVMAAVEDGGLFLGWQYQRSVDSIDTCRCGTLSVLQGTESGGEQRHASGPHMAAAGQSGRRMPDKSSGAALLPRAMTMGASSTAH